MEERGGKIGDEGGKGPDENVTMLLEMMKEERGEYEFLKKTTMRRAQELSHGGGWEGGK